jgi:CSLREA domain-containing protein
MRGCPSTSAARTGSKRRAAVALMIAACLFLAAVPANAATIAVNSKADMRADDGFCTLREAIIAANTNSPSGPSEGECQAGNPLPQPDIILLFNASGSPDLFTLSLAGRDEDGAATGDLDITESVSIRGQSIGETIVQAGTTTANGIDRVFDVVQGSAAIAVAFENLTIRHGLAIVPAGGVAASAQGGGIYVRAVASGLASSLAVTDASVTLNSSAGNGGGIAVAGGFAAIAPSVTLLRADVSSNTAALGGGGVMCSACTLSIDSSAVVSNTAQVSLGVGHGGGGLRITGDGLTSSITNSTLGDNRTNGDGGGAAIPVGTATAQFTYTTLHLNRADFDANSTGVGGALRNASGTVQLNRSIVAGNLRHSSTASDCSGTISSVAYNVLGISGGCVTGGTGTVTTSDVKLSTLDFHGGTTRDYAPIVASPALARIPSAQCAATVDQRGFVRPVGSSCEAGAIENSRPTVVANDGGTMLEDAGPQGFPFTVNDFETPGTLVITAVSSVTALVPNSNLVPSGSGSSRTLTATSLADQSGSTQITITVNDGDASASDPFILTVAPVNDPPTLTALATPVTLAEDATTQTVNLAGIGAGGGESQALTVTATSDNTALIPHPAPTYSSPNSTGSISFTPVANGNGSATITVTVTDNGDGTNSASRSFVVNVTPLNDAPAISNIANQTPAYGTAPTIPFTVFDEESPGALTVAATSSNQALVTDANLTFGGSGANRTITVTPTAGVTGTTTITVTVDDGTATDSDSFDVTITRPELSIANATVVEGTGGSVTAILDVTLSQTSPAPITVEYSTQQDTAVAGVDFTTAAGTLTFAPGVTIQTIAVTIASDAAVEIDEWATVTLSNPTNAFLIDASGRITVTDDDATVERTARLAVWRSPVGVTAPPGALTKTAAAGWNAGAASAEALLDGDGAMEFTASETTTIRIAGLSRGNSNTDWTDIDFGLYLSSDTNLYVVEGGVTRGRFGTYGVRDRFAVAVEGGVVVYRRNGTLIYASGVAPGYPLLVDTALFTSSATLTDVVVSGRLARPVTWTNLAGASAVASVLSKTAAVGWNAGAASTRALVSGDGALEFTATETTTTRMIGLSGDNSGTGLADIDFGLYLHSNATVYIVEAGVTRGLFGGYATGDRFQVAIESGQVIYRRNGVVLYTSAVAPTFPLLADTALFTPGATLADVALAGTFASDVTFAGITGSAASGNTLTKSAANGWNAGAFSTRALAKGDGFVEFTTAETTTHKMLGFGHGQSSTDFAEIDLGVLLASNGTFYVFEGGVSQGVFGSYMAGDRFRVAIEGGVVKYRRNGVLFHTSAALPSYPLLVDMALYSPAATISDVVLSGDLGGAVTWTAATRATAGGSSLTKTGAVGWNAGAISTRAIASGDGFVAFTTSEATTHKLIGLSAGNTDTDFADVDFAILLAANGTYYVFEAGTFRGVFGAYTAGDRFAVAVEAGVVVYQRNGAVFYTSAVAPTYPLLVDTALYTTGATFSDVVLGCVSAVCQ